MASKTSVPSEGPRAARLAPEPKPVRGAEQEKLGVFVGDWRGQGVSGDGTPMTTSEIYDWVEGRFFLSNRFDQQVGKNRHTGVGVLGFDPNSRSYFARFVDNLGYNRQYEVRDEGRGVWRFLGERERAFLTFDGDKLKIHWDYRPDGGDWAVLCEFECVNQRPSAMH
jgi:Protein of unknown function (DUF1579)